MRAIRMYRPPDGPAPIPAFMASLDVKLREKLRWQLFRLTTIPQCEIKEPHFKHFVIERYSSFYELREKNRILVRIIFTMSGGDILLLTPFVKTQPRDTRKALEQSLKMLTEIRGHPDRAADFTFTTKEGSE